jgi:hypothetical protein
VLLPGSGDEAVADKRAQFVELDALVIFLHVDDQHLPDQLGAVQQISGSWSDPDLDNVAERPGGGEELPRVPQQLQRMPTSGSGLGSPAGGVRAKNMIAPFR